MKLSEGREQRFVAFREWLNHNTELSERPIGDAVSRVKRVERGLPEMLGGVDLDAEYARDQLDSVIRALEYTLEDVHNHREPPDGIVFKFGHDDARFYEKIREGLSSLHYAVQLYRNFCDAENQRLG